jgi:hypothetical protein
MMRLVCLPAAGVLLATSLTVAACGTAKGSHSAAAASTAEASSMAAAAPTPTTPPEPGATAPAGSRRITAGDSSGQAVSPMPPESAPPEQAGFASALAAWKLAARTSAAAMGNYLVRAADDLRTSGRSSYDTATNDLTYLAHLPVTNDTPAQQAKAHADVQALDSFFGTPGLMR